MCDSNADCGVGAFCDINASACVCDGGHFVLKDFGFEENDESCRGIFLYFYIVYGILAVVMLLNWCYLATKIKRKRQCIRFIPPSLAIFLISFLLLYKATQPDTVFMSDDILLTVLLALSHFFGMMGIVVLLYKYFKFLGNMHNSVLFKVKSLKSMKLFIGLQLFIALIFAVMITVTCFVETGATKVSLVRASYGTLILGNLCGLVGVVVTRREMSKVLSVKSSNEKNTLRYLNVKKQSLRFLDTLVSYFILYSLCAVPAVVEESLEYFIYILPLHALIASVHTLVLRYVAKATIKALKKSRTGKTEKPLVTKSNQASSSKLLF